MGDSEYSILKFNMVLIEIAEVNLGTPPQTHQDDQPLPQPIKSQKIREAKAF